MLFNSLPMEKLYSSHPFLNLLIFFSFFKIEIRDIEKKRSVLKIYNKKIQGI